MRVPELNWPSNLFTDIIIVPAEMIMVSAPAHAARPDLWREMRASRMGDRSFPAGPWHVHSSDASHDVA